MKYHASFLSLLLPAWAGATQFVSQPSVAKHAGRKLNSQPNIIFLLVDDLGSGDVDVCPEDIPLKRCPFRTTTEARKTALHTPRLKTMAEEGQILTNFYSPRSICTPSRAGYMTGRDPARYGMIDELFRILQTSSSRGGLPTSEKAMGKAMKELGYATGYTGKWHMGDTNGTSNAAYTPINHGFDFVKFFIEGSKGEACDDGTLNPPDDNNIYHFCSFDHISDCDPVTRECEVVEQPIRWENATARQLVAFKEFIDLRVDDGKPFFYQHSFPHVHVPWTPSRHFVSDHTSKLWTDMVGEVDWAVGYVFQYLKKHGLDDNTMVVFSSDNGPFLEAASSWCPANCRFQVPGFQREDESNVANGYGCGICDAETVSKASLDKGGKTNTWEGGQHVPTIIRWPAKITPGTINPIVSSGLDLLPTFVSIAGGTLDPGIEYDGYDISESLMTEVIDPAAEPEGTFVYWCGVGINAVRIGRYKIIFVAQKFSISFGAPDTPVPKYLCAGTGECCAGNRSCPCIFADKLDEPVMIDLYDNPREDFGRKIDYANDADLASIVEEATTMRFERMKSSLESRNVNPFAFGETYDNMTALLNGLPNFPQTDLCDATPGIKLGPFFCGGEKIDRVDTNGCAWLPDECQKELLPGNTESTFQQQNCSIAGTYQGPECAERLPCCEQDGYKGPFEYIKPVSSAPDGWDGDIISCGCFDQGPKASNNGQNSYFPDDEEMQLSVCEWQQEVEDFLNSSGLNAWTHPRIRGFCRLPACGDDNPTNAQSCYTIEKYGLNNVPTGFMFNSPYPDTQFDNVSSTFLYPNQDYAPGECENGNGQNCKNGNKGINSDNPSNSGNQGGGGGTGNDCDKFTKKKACNKSNNGCYWDDGNDECIEDSASKASGITEEALAKEKSNSGMTMTNAFGWALLSVSMMWLQWK